MVPIVDSFKYNQVENNLKDKVIPYYKSVDIGKLKEAINKIKDNPDYSCASCGINLTIRPWCAILLNLFIISIMLQILRGLIFVQIGAYSGCLWAWAIIFFLT